MITQDQERNSGLKRSLWDLIETRKRQRFNAPVKGLPENLRLFVISPGGQYVRLQTDSKGTGHGDYGFANPEDQSVSDPVLNPLAGEVEFPSLVYSGLGEAMSLYGNRDRSGPLSVYPTTGSRIAGYYVETKDDLPIVCETAIEGLFISVAHSHLGIRIPPRLLNQQQCQSAENKLWDL